MNKTQKNIVIVGFNDYEIRNIGVPPIGKIIYVSSMLEAKKHQGYMLIVNNKNKLDIVSFDKKYRKILNKYAFIWLYGKNNKYYKDKFSRIELYDDYIYSDICLNVWEDYDKYKHELVYKNLKTFTKKRLENINKISKYLKDFDNIKTSKMSADLNMNVRTIERYMTDINEIYHNIGYDYSKNEWYIIR